MTMFQPMPDLPDEQYEALRADIEANGVIVPIVVDQHGRILDGHNRKRIAESLGIEVPTEVRTVTDDDEAADLAVTLNCARRHLTREQVRQVVAAEIARRPTDSDRAIARRVGCSPTTVGAVRNPQVSNLDTPELSREEAEKRTAEIQGHLDAVREHVGALVYMGLCGQVAPAEIVMALTAAQRAHERRSEPHVAEVFRVAVFMPLIDAAMSPLQDLDDTFEPMSDEDRSQLLRGIASLADSVRTEGHG